MSTAPQQQRLPTAKAPRMTLASVTRGKQDAPYRVLMYGQEGIGKSTFGAGAPSPIFLGAEDGTAQLDVARFPRPESMGDIYEALTTLAKDQHDFRTLVIDTLDWLEPLVWDAVCRADGVKSIEEVGGGYGKGYTAALDEWRKLYAALERLQKLRSMHVVLLAHSHIKTFKNPEGEDFDRYQLKLHDKAAGVAKEWADAVLFARQETLVHKEKKARAKGVGVEERVIHTERSAAFDAKNRYSLPSSLPLSWIDFDEAAKAGQVASPDALRAEIARKAAELGGDLERVVIETMRKAGDNAQQLAAVNNRCNVKLAEKAANAAPAAEEKH